MTAAIFGAKLLWLEGTSHGEILTRFTSDMNAVDERLSHGVGYMIESVAKLLSILFTSASFSLYDVSLFAALLYCYLTIGMRLVSVLRRLKTIRQTAASSLQQHVTAVQTPDGVPTVRAYGMSAFFIDRMHELIDDNTSSIWHMTLCSVMMDLQLGMLGALFVTSSCLGICLTGADAGTAGVALSFAMQFNATMAGFLKRIATVESGLNSVGRIAEYSRVPQEPGSIAIDDIDISTVKLNVLRRRILIIPQDPHLFAGSLRSTLDPHGTHDDGTLITLLKRLRLHATTGEDGTDMPFTNLSFTIEDGGRNISQGQRQLLCLASALLSRKRIVIMDEATSALDMETDVAIQAAIREGLPDATVVVVAHRLATVAGFDKVLVLEDGRAVESGEPRELYLRRQHFWRLVRCSSDQEELAERIMGGE
ncbi:hypothetical protein ACCO45_003401 [Purpureocillium lilacinum]|uniref:Uncharacterized protein n=1 Tax=Purpureocillium lilacinum TaxID=33203 RepID=A0ACC4E0X2_PURLI